MDSVERTTTSLGENLIFVISQPRAGSTMLQKVLGAHPEIHTLSEPWVALHPLFALKEEGFASDFDPALAHRGVTDFLHHLSGGVDDYWEALRRMLGYLYGRALEGTGKVIFLDKTPRYYFIIPELRRVFPRARIVILLRNPLAVLASMLETWIGDEDIANLRHARHDLMAAPRLILEAMRNPDVGGIVVHYEDLAAAPEIAFPRLCEHLGISFHPEMIEYGASAAGRARWQFGDQGTVYWESRPVSARINHWRETFARSEEWRGSARNYLAALGPDTIAELGYQYDELRAALPAPDQAAAEYWHELMTASA